MRFSTVFSVLACGAMAMAAAITPDVLVRRSNTDISNALTGLDQKCDAIFPKFDTCKDSVCTEAIVTEIVQAVEVATSACVGVVGVLDFALTKQIANIIIKIVVKVDSHQKSCGVLCGALSVYAKIDLCISLLLKQLAICVSGILAPIAALLAAIVATLEGLTWSLILAVCSLTPSA